MANLTQSAKGEWISQYFAAGVATAITIGFFYQYALLRYGVAGLSTLNKSLATSTFFLLGIVLLLGPVSRMFSIFDRLFKYRKELGVLTFYTGAAHVYLSMFVVARRGPWGLYLAQPLSAYSGLVALIIMFLLLIISLRAMELTLGTKLWWYLQNWGARIAFILIAVHMAVLKYSGWAPWLLTRGTEITTGVASLPPETLLGAVFAAFVLVVRLSEVFGAKAARAITQISFLVTFAGTIWLFV